MLTHMCALAGRSIQEEEQKERDGKREKERESQWVEAEKVNWFTNI